MIKLDKTAVMNLENAIRGARNPLNSWEKSDSYTDSTGNFILGENDRSLGRRLCGAGSDHRKFIRQIFVSVDITAPLYWWKEFDTYKISTVANSTSTMHKIHSKPFTIEDFSHDRMSDETKKHFLGILEYLEFLRTEFIKTNEKKYWYDMIQFLPSSYNQMRTVTMNYENLTNMYFARRNHKLDEWHVYCDWIKDLPYSEDFIILGR